jgi:hypothetical protein
MQKNNRVKVTSSFSRPSGGAPPRAKPWTPRGSAAPAAGASQPRRESSSGRGGSQPHHPKQHLREKRNVVLDYELDIASFRAGIQKIIDEAKYPALNDETAGDLSAKIKNWLYPYFIKVTHSSLANLAENGEFKIILTANRQKANFAIPFVKICNGLIMVISAPLGEIEAQIVCIPSAEFSPNFKHAIVDRLLSEKKYRVFEINDGTTLNLWYSETAQKWEMATRNAFSVESLNWRGFSYRQVVQDALNDYTSFDFAKLDKGRSYSIGFKHPAFHPFAQPREWAAGDFIARPCDGGDGGDDNAAEQPKWIRHAWFIQSIALDGTGLRLDEDIGLPLQHQIDSPAVEKMSEITKRLENSLCEFVTSQNKQLFLGYILRSVDGAEPDLLMESYLWSTIRHAIYQLPFTPDKSIRSKCEENFKSMKYIIVEAYLDLRKRNVFIQLFPQYSAIYHDCKRLLDDTTEKIYLLMKDQPIPAPTTAEQQEFEKRVDLVVNKFISLVRDKYKLTDSDSQDKRMILKVLTNPRFAEFYYQTLEL